MELTKHVSEKVITVWKIHGLIAVIIGFAVTLAVGILSYIFDWPMWITFVLILLWIIDMVFEIFIRPKLKWRILLYEVNEQEIEIQDGLFVIKRTLVPMIRVQHVESIQGPILKKYGLATIKIHTAATVHEIPGLTLEVAEQLRHRISQLARVADEDV